jgi:ABC-type phosphate/phosphonate transport system substrate-binding protein
MTPTVSRFSALVCCFLILLYICAVNAAEAESPTRKNSKPILSFGFDSNIIITAELKDVRTAIDSWMAKAAEENNIEQTTQIFSDSKSLINSIKIGQLNAVCTSSLNYLYISRLVDVEATFGYVRMGKKTQKYILIVAANSEISDIKMLKEKKIVLRGGDDIGEFFLNILLLRNKLEQTNKFFSNTIFKRTGSQAILSVFFGQADACITQESIFNTITELNPQVGRRLKVIAESDELVNVVCCFSKSFDSETKLKVRDWLINFGNTIRGKQLLDMFKVDGVIRIDESDLQSMRKLLNEYETLNQKNVVTRAKSGNHPKN